MKLTEAAVLTGTAAIASLTRTAIEDHRIHTHKSLAFKDDRAEVVYRAAGAHLTDTKRWASVHRIHHSTPDMNLEPFVQLADYLDWRDDPSSDTSGHPDLPEFIYGLDPAVDNIDLATARAIGAAAREIVADPGAPAGGVYLYERQASYSAQEGSELLSDTGPRYFYETSEKMKRDRREPVEYDPDNLPTLHDIRFLLRDPHSPALHPEGIPGVLRDNVPLYAYVEQNFEDPHFRQVDLRPDKVDYWTRRNRAKLRYAYVGSMALAGVLIGRSAKPEKMAMNAFAGAAASGAAVLALIAGGNLTNSGGHAGNAKKLFFGGRDIDKVKLRDLRHLSLRGLLKGTVYPKANGTYTANSKALSPATLDEVGGQEVHHDHPDFIAYSLDSGAKRFRDAPFGRFLEFLVDRGIIFQKGANFIGHDRRPDLPSNAAVMLQDYRAKRLAEAT